MGVNMASDTVANMAVSKGLLNAQYGQQAQMSPMAIAIKKRRLSMYNDKPDDNGQPDVDPTQDKL